MSIDSNDISEHLRAKEIARLEETIKILNDNFPPKGNDDEEYCFEVVISALRKKLYTVKDQQKYE
jgi:hypothetical protein